MGFLLYKLILISPALILVMMFALAQLVKPKRYRYACTVFAWLAFYPLWFCFIWGGGVGFDQAMGDVNAGRMTNAFWVFKVFRVVEWLVLGVFVFVPYLLCFVFGLRAGKGTPRSQWSAIMKEFG